MLKKLIPHSLAALLILTVVLSGCGGGKSSRTTIDNPTIYVGGSYYNGTSDMPCYWDASGKRYYLDCNGCINPNLLCLSFYNNELNVIGYYDSNGMKIGYWDNTGGRHDLYDLVDAGYDSHVYCSFIYNGQVYVGGNFYSSGNWLPCYWDKDGRHDLPVDGEDLPGVSSIFVDGSGVYAAGWYKGADDTEPTIYYWKPDKEDSQRHAVFKIDGGVWATQIVVDNNRVYIYMSGAKNNNAYYWVWDSDEQMVKEYPLDGGTVASSIFVSNNQVYFGGWYNDGEKQLPCYWDGAGNRHSLANPDSDYAEVNSIFVYNNRVYAAGGYLVPVGEDGKYYACYWDDTGERHDLDTGGNSGIATCILVR